MTPKLFTSSKPDHRALAFLFLASLPILLSLLLLFSDLGLGGVGDMKVAAIDYFQHFQKGKYHLYLLHGRDKKAHIQDTDHANPSIFLFLLRAHPRFSNIICGVEFVEDLLL